VVFDQYPDHKVSAEITEVGVEASEATRTYPLTLSLAQPEQFKIVAGMAGKATGKPKSVPADQVGIEVPVTAVFDGDDPQTSCVWVVGDDQTVARRVVEVGGLTLRGVGISKGLKPGERIVTAGVSYLEDGQKVRIDKE
jgi:multidrug efflux pump subunit AcrA (membrane-fusion protein)